MTLFYDTDHQMYLINIQKFKNLTHLKNIELSYQHSRNLIVKIYKDIYNKVTNIVQFINYKK